jgi:hypothetical protein
VLFAAKGSGAGTDDAMIYTQVCFAPPYHFFDHTYISTASDAEAGLAELTSTKKHVFKRNATPTKSCG